MEHINGVWIPIGIFTMILLGCIFSLIGTPKVRQSDRDTTYRDRSQPHPDRVAPTRPA